MGFYKNVNAHIKDLSDPGGISPKDKVFTIPGFEGRLFTLEHAYAYNHDYCEHCFLRENIQYNRNILCKAVHCADVNDDNYVWRVYEL